MNREIQGSEIEQIVKFIELKRYELMNKGNHPRDIALLLPYWLHISIQNYYNTFFNGDFPHNFLGIEPTFHYKDEVVLYNFRHPHNDAFIHEIRVKENQEVQPTCKPIK
jgi:hypothetical protein